MILPAYYRNAADPQGRAALPVFARRWPGGQHVNRSATQAELLFDVAHSPNLSEEQRACIQSVLGTRIDQEGVPHLFSSGTRGQLRNRDEVTARFQTLLRRALQLGLGLGRFTPDAGEFGIEFLDAGQNLLGLRLQFLALLRAGAFELDGDLLQTR